MGTCATLRESVVTVVIVCFLLLMTLHPPVKVHLTQHASHGYHATESQNNIITTATVKVLMLPLVGVTFIGADRVTCSTVKQDEELTRSSINTDTRLTRNTPQVESQLTPPPLEPKPLQECSVEVEIQPCSCTRRVVARVAAPCPPGGEELLRRVKEEFGESTCSDLATLRGPGQQVVSFSVFGAFPSDYHSGIRRLVPRIREVYPGWNVRVYVDSTGSSPALLPWMCSLACHHTHLDFCDVTQLPTVEGVWQDGGQGWRLGVVGEGLVSRYLVRDADSPLLTREVHAVQEWLAQGTCYHIMRDHPFHGVEMLAGLWGGCNTWEGAAGARVGRYALCTAMQDQALLKTQMWPVAKLNATVHDSYTCRRFPGSQPFPTQRVNFTFVGQRTLRSRYRWERTYTICPAHCRPPHHQDWLYC